ncbi:MAG TPA: hypothetical protein DFS52_07720 [Myxococcales bacterium]|jgi:hypothetical protein|nr:hypothetical protein [Myxococcales bacterium]
MTLALMALELPFLGIEEQVFRFRVPMIGCIELVIELETYRCSLVERPSCSLDDHPLLTLAPLRFFSLGMGVMERAARGFSMI